MASQRSGLYFVIKDRFGSRGAGGAGQPAPPRRGLGWRKRKAKANGHLVGPGNVSAKREELSKQFVELQWDLGGMAYEMASRDHFRLDLLVRKAAELQRVDSELGQLERLLKMEESGAAGACPNCSALQARGAVFCWQCGQELTPSSKPSGTGA